MIQNRLPNILLIVMDSVRADHMSCYGYKRRTTPNLDEFAAQATLYTHCYANSAWSLPSYASILTGLYPHNHRVWDLHTQLPEVIPTLPEILKKHGYRTGCFTSNPWLKLGGLHRGFDTYVEVGRRHKKAQPLGRLGRAAQDIERRVRRLFFLGDQETQELLHHLTAWLTQYTASGKPWFALAVFMETHTPYNPPRPFHRFFTRSPLRNYLSVRGITHLQKQVASLEKKELLGELVRRAQALYDGAIAYLDSRLGELLTWIDENRHFGEAIVILTSDHGEQFGEHLWRGIPLFGHAFSLFDTLLHVPLVIRFSDGESAERVHAPVELVDLLPTILSAVGIAIPEVRVDGTDVRPPVLSTDRILLAEYRPSVVQLRTMWRLLRQHDPALTITSLDVSLRTIRQNGFKLYVSSDGSAPRLTRPTEDPLETCELSSEYPDVLERLLASLGDWPDWMVSPRDPAGWRLLQRLISPK